MRHKQPVGAVKYKHLAPVGRARTWQSKAQPLFSFELEGDEFMPTLRDEIYAVGLLNLVLYVV